EPARFLRELDRQTFRDFELIVVDQNPDDRLAGILKSFNERFTIVRARSEKGLSRARNVGLRIITGDIVAFPDDDCWYPSELLERVKNFFDTHPELHGLTGRPIGERGQTVLGQYDGKAGQLTKFNVWRRINSNTLFLRRDVVARVGGFDESLGVGSGTPWGSSEDIDYPLRALRDGFKIFYDPSFSIFHPDDTADKDLSFRTQKAYAYSLGRGRVLRKHHYPTWFLAYNLIGPLRPSFIAMLRGRLQEARYFWLLTEGRLRGWLDR